jgi:hypothetical protein
MQWAVGVSQFQWLAQNQTRQARFNSYMSSRRQGRQPWFEFYPVYERLIEGANAHPNWKDDLKRAGIPLLIDIGGNQGHDLKWFKSTFHDAPGRLILQDLPNVVLPQSLPEGIETMGYSFFDPQPVQGK